MGFLISGYGSCSRFVKESTVENCLIIISPELTVRSNSVTSQHGGLEISSSGFKLAWKSLVFRVFPVVSIRLFVTQQRRRNGRRLVHKVMKNGFEMLEKVRFLFRCTCQFSCNFACYYNLHFGISLVQNFFRSSKNPLNILEIF